MRNLLRNIKNMKGKLFLIIGGFLFLVLIFCLINSSKESKTNSEINVNKPQSYDPKPASYIPQVCQTDCVTKFGETLGVNNNVIGHSNCSNNCSNFEDGGAYLNKNTLESTIDFFTGIKWQCVEYSRRWLIINKGYTYKSIDFAYQIFDIEHAIGLNGKQNAKFSKFPNNNITPPRFGDLAIFQKDSENPYGHVAVIVNVNLDLGYVDIAEQNYTNDYWEDRNSYSRRIKLFKSSEGKYYLTEIPYKDCESLTTDQCKQKEDPKTNLVIGWKRIEEEIK